MTQQRAFSSFLHKGNYANEQGMMKKILHSLFSLALIVSLAACVSSGGGNPWSGQQNAEAPASAEPNPLTREALTREILSPSQGLKVEGGSAAQAGYETAEAQTQAPYQPPEFETIIDSTTAPRLLPLQKRTPPA
jgi:hypothetical protein